ncbi:MAG: Ldh family oxidoreductase [Granulosicoccus sp.]
MHNIPLDQLQQFAKSLLLKGGFSEQHATDTANVLTWADARGSASHGVLRIPRYVEMVESGEINTAATLSKELSDNAIAVLNANKMPGASAMLACMEEAINIANQYAIGWCSIKNITHAGAVGYYALKAAERGMVGVVMSASKPLMAYHGARASGLSTNPISVAVPKANNPLLLDMSTSTVALGKILHAKDAQKEIPLDWGIDSTGSPTTDATKVETLTPLGGPKGSGLSLMIEILASVLISNPVISEALAGKKSTMNGLALVLDIKRFTDPEVFARQINELVSSLYQLPKAQGTESILMPGERGFELAKVRLNEGISLTQGTASRLIDLAEKLEVPVPQSN